GRTSLIFLRRAASLCALDVTHVTVMYGGNMTIVPGNRDRVPTRFGDPAAVSSVTLPANAITLLEGFGFGGRHGACPIGSVYFDCDAFCRNIPTWRLENKVRN